MALNIISLNKFERITEYCPNYIAEFELDRISGKCEIYTNALLFKNGKRIHATNRNYTNMNGNLYLRAESITKFVKFNDRKLGKELRKIIECKKPEI